MMLAHLRPENRQRRRAEPVFDPAEWPDTQPMVGLRSEAFAEDLPVLDEVLVFARPSGAAESGLRRPPPMD